LTIREYTCFHVLGEDAMAARTGAEYKAGLKDDRVVYLGDGKVDVAKDPRLPGRSMAWPAISTGNTPMPMTA
jgi:hypothetical protein